MTDTIAWTAPTAPAGWITARTASWLVALALMAPLGLAASADDVARTPVDFDTSIRAALALLDLDRPGLERVRAAANEGDYETAGRELLTHYRQRDDVRHPIDRDRLPDRRGRPMGDRLRTIADNALEHRFVGQPSYGPQDLGDPIDWSAEPAADDEWRWQLHRLRWWRMLGRAYWHTGEEIYARAWAEQLLDWVAEHPRHPARAYAWRSLEAGHRARSWAEDFQYFIDTPVMTPRVLAVFLVGLHEHGQHLMDHHSAGSNWALMEAAGLLHAGIIFPEFRDAETWQDEAIRRLNEEMQRQVYPDGHQRELSISYHVGAMRNFDDAVKIARLNDSADAFPDAFHERFERMVAVLMKLGLPDGRLAQFGSSWKGDEGHAWDVIANWLDEFPREDFEYLATRGKSGRPPAQTAFALPDSGFYSMRSGWDESAVCLVFKNGPAGGFHSHPDNGTFEMYARGRHLMPESGVYTYSAGNTWYDWFRRTRAHQTLTLDERDIASAPRRRLWRPGDEHDVLVIENDSYPGLTHRRAAFFVNREFLVLIDDAIISANGTAEEPIEGTLRLHYHFAPGEAVFDDEKRLARTDYKDGINLAVHAVGPDDLALERREGWISFKYGEREPRPAFAFTAKLASATRAERFVTVLVPYDGEAPELMAHISDRASAGSNTAEVEVMINSRRYQLRYDLDRGTSGVSGIAAENERRP